jgi:KUP system potassium uptake protein
MGHFGRKAIGFSWLTLVYPCLMLNYMGQGALLLSNPAAAENPFFLMAPEWARLPLVSSPPRRPSSPARPSSPGAFSVTHQAIQLGFLPRLRTEHYEREGGRQIYIPAVNWGCW